MMVLGRSLAALLCLWPALFHIASTNLNDPPESLPCEFYHTANISDGVLQPDGSWFHEGLHYPTAFYAYFNYVEDESGVQYNSDRHVRGCVCLLKNCLHTCCFPNQFVNWSNGEGNGSCRSGNNFKSLKYSVGIDEKHEVDLYADFAWAVRKPACSLHFLNPEYQSDVWHLLANGSVYLPEENSLLNSSDFCIGLDEGNLVVLKCIDLADPEARFFFLPIGMFLSIPFLLATFIVYALIPELRNVHGKSLMSYVLGLTVGYAILASVQMYGNKQECRDGREQCFSNAVCSTLGYIIYFSFMVSFFWLNTMCFDIFWTFRGVRGNAPRHNFKFYCLYAWGVPTLVTLAAIGIQHTDIDRAYKINIGEGSCFLDASSGLGEFIYLYSILIILIFSNVFFFVITAIRIIQVQKETAVVTSQGSSARHSRHSYEKYRYWLYLRLFVVMGVSWFFEVLSWALGPRIQIFILSDLYNCIQGILIFLLVVWNEKVKKLVIKRLNKFRGITEAEPQTSIRTAASTSVSIRRTTSIPMDHGKLLSS